MPPSFFPSSPVNELTSGLRITLSFPTTTRRMKKSEENKNSSAAAWRREGRRQAVFTTALCCLPLSLLSASHYLPATTPMPTLTTYLPSCLRWLMCGWDIIHADSGSVLTFLLSAVRRDTLLHIRFIIQRTPVPHMYHTPPFTCPFAHLHCIHVCHALLLACTLHFCWLAACHTHTACHLPLLLPPAFCPLLLRTCLHALLACFALPLFTCHGTFLGRCRHGFGYLPPFHHPTPPPPHTTHTLPLQVLHSSTFTLHTPACSLPPYFPGSLPVCSVAFFICTSYLHFYLPFDSWFAFALCT